MRRILLIILLSASIPLCCGFVSTNVPLDHWSYDAIDRLIGHELIKSSMMIMGATGWHFRYHLMILKLSSGDIRSVTAFLIPVHLSLKRIYFGKANQHYKFFIVETFHFQRKNTIWLKLLMKSSMMILTVSWQFLWNSGKQGMWFILAEWTCNALSTKWRTLNT